MGLVTVQEPTGSIQYNTDNGTMWYNTVTVSTDVAWYARLNMTYSGSPLPIEVVWELETATGLTELAFTTRITVNEGWNVIYVSSDGSQLSNYNWGQLAMQAGSYCVWATIYEA